MKTEMLQAFTVGEANSWADIPGLDLDASWLDPGKVCNIVPHGIGALLEGIGWWRFSLQPGRKALSLAMLVLSVTCISGSCGKSLRGLCRDHS